MITLALLASCKVPITDVNAGFTLADVSWFAEEETMFVFYEVTAEQGLGEPSVVEITWMTDDGQVDWTPVVDLPTVHTHLPVDCGTTSLCGSASIHVPLEPRQVSLRLRYHRDGALALDASTVYNVVGPGPAHSNRSLLVYGVFDEVNNLVQWRARHQFPTLRNQQAERYGLRRQFTVRDQRYGTDDTLATADDPYGYGASCPSAFTPFAMPDVSTNERAAFNDDILPAAASTASTVCAQAEVTDATGTFVTGAIARKNPEVRAAFPVLRSPVREAVRVPFYLGMCERTISEEHEAMLRQRLQLEGVPETCIDDWAQPGFANALATTMIDAVEAARAGGDDMVLVIALEQDEIGVSDVVEDALALVVPQERDRTSPRLSGAFVLDSTIHTLSTSSLTPVVLWCPASLYSYDASALACAVAPENPQFDLGPFSFGSLPILPPRDQYLDFIANYSVAQAGKTLDLSFRTPEFSTLADHVLLDPFGAATFLNDEVITADGDDAFSYCVQEDVDLAVFRSDRLEQAGPQLAYYCYYNYEYVGLPADACAFAALGLLPLQYLPDWHELSPERLYDLGMAWDFPYLLQMDYQVSQAGNVTAFGFTVPFGLAAPGQSYYGTSVWTQEEFSLDPLLSQCTRFCDYPTFDSAGVYHVNDLFRATYAHSCYTPLFPEVGDDGFPIDP